VTARAARPSKAARAYRLLVLLGVPLRRWCRLEVRGADVLRPPATAMLVVANHDSMLDPLALADTLVRAGRPARFLAMDALWRWRIPAALLDATGQIPIRRGAADVAAMRTAIDALAAGETVCIFPEGGLSQGQPLRARRGVSRLIRSAPDAEVVLAAVRGGTELVRFPRRPRVGVELFRPTEPQPRPGEDDAAFAGRLLGEIRERVPPAPAGRRRVVVADSPAADASVSGAAGARTPSS
jgi:1-acyl-sn-glycerol-3-phosphate acyltransferase